MRRERGEEEEEAFERRVRERQDEAAKQGLYELRDKMARMAHMYQTVGQQAEAERIYVELRSLIPNVFTRPQFEVDHYNHHEWRDWPERYGELKRSTLFRDAEALGLLPAHAWDHDIRAAQLGRERVEHLHKIGKFDRYMYRGMDQDYDRAMERLEEAAQASNIPVEELVDPNVGSVQSYRDAQRRSALMERRTKMGF